MKFHTRILFGGFVLVGALLLVGAHTPQAAYAQDKGKGGGGGFGGGKGGPSPKTDPKFVGMFRDSVTKASKSTYRIQCDGKDTALGVAVSADGFILTKLSDLTGKITVKTADGLSLIARIVGRHEAHDLAMLKVEATGFAPVEWSESKVAPVGYFVASVGTGQSPVAVGVVSVAARTVPAPPKGIAKGGPAPAAGYLGAYFADSAKGAIVTEVIPNTPAVKAAIKANDVILAVASKPVKDSDELIKTIQKHKAGETITLKVLRGEEELELKATLGKQTPARADQQNNMGSALSNKRSGFPVILQHDSVVLPQDCGGALVDLEGHVLGINIARAGRVESYAIPAEVIQPLLPTLMGKTEPAKK